MKKSTSVDNSALTYYESGFEHNRLRTGIGLIEFERTKEILLEKLPKAPAVIYDIGGAYGEYSWWLTSLGYEVHLFDLFPKNIEMSKELSILWPCPRKSGEPVKSHHVIARSEATWQSPALMCRSEQRSRRLPRPCGLAMTW